ncbi:MAG: hypothetical protein AAGF83_06240 [Cyanobacteria bacterium P01_G01_bin.67]
MKILITGFEPNDDGLNASELVVNSLRDNPPQEIAQYTSYIDFKILPGNTKILGQIIDDILESTAPDICLGIGQARGYNRIALERIAKNLKYFVTLDRAGNAPKGEPVVSDAPLAYLNSLVEQDALIPLLESYNIPCKVSNDCGTHLCNQSFYHFLHWKNKLKKDTKVGFIHIPAVPEQVIKHWTESPFMPKEMTCQAIAVIIDKQIQLTTKKIEN